MDDDNKVEAVFRKSLTSKHLKSLNSGDSSLVNKFKQELIKDLENPGYHKGFVNIGPEYEELRRLRSKKLAKLWM